MNNKKIQKKKLIISMILIIISLAIFFAILSSKRIAQKKANESFFIEAMKHNDASFCQNILSTAKISGEEIRSLIAENNYDNRVNFLHYVDGYSMRDSCEDLINSSKEAQIKFPRKD